MAVVQVVRTKNRKRIEWKDINMVDIRYVFCVSLMKVQPSGCKRESWLLVRPAEKWGRPKMLMSVLYRALALEQHSRSSGLTSTENAG
jgi:hypothetical protein